MDDEQVRRTLQAIGPMSFEDFLGSDDPAIEATIQRFAKSLDDPDGIISAFQSFASSD